MATESFFIENQNLKWGLSNSLLPAVLDSTGIKFDNCTVLIKVKTIYPNKPLWHLDFYNAKL